jgi:hypothetical protein
MYITAGVHQSVCVCDEDIIRRRQKYEMQNEDNTRTLKNDEGMEFIAGGRVLSYLHRRRIQRREFIQCDRFTFKPAVESREEGV